MPRIAKVIPQQLPNGSWLIDTAALKPRYRKVWPTELEAIRDAARIKRQIAGVGMNAEQLRSFDAAQHRLETTEAAGKGKDIAFVVDWFIAHYRPPGGHDINWYIADYIKRREKHLEEKSIVEIRSYLLAFGRMFGHMLPADITPDAIEAYLAANTSRYYRDKAIRPFFTWLTGVVLKKARIAKLLNAPLDRSPLDYVERVDYEKLHPTEILYYSEVLAVLKKAKEVDLGVLAWFVFGLQTGMRPEAEARQFWKLEGHGWGQIDIERGIICVTDEIEKTGGRTRDIAIQSSLKAWLLWFKANNVMPVYSRRKIREVLKAAVPHRRSQDIIRRTFISFACKIMPEHDVCYQGATSSRMIKKHYRRLVPESEVAPYWAITPESLGLV